MGRRFNWDDLQHFLAVARAGTISDAGRRLGADHATVGRRVTALEESLSVKLFERTARGYTLTRGGEQLLAYAARIESETMRAERDLAGPHRTLAGAVRISTLEGFANFFLARRLAPFAAENPRLAIELIAIQQIMSLGRREADVSVTIAPPKDGRFVSEPLTDYKLFVYASPEYLARQEPIRRKADLVRHPFVGYIDDLVFAQGLNYLNEISEGLVASLQSSSLHAQMEATAAGFGLCVLPAFIGRSRGDLVPVIPDRFALTRRYWLVSHEDVAEIARVRLARRFIREAVTREQSLFLEAGLTPA